MPNVLKPSYDIAVIGSGFGGSLMSMIAKCIGLSVVMIERGRHPRFAIGESTSPLTNLLIEQLANRYDLPRLLPLTSYGPWQRTYPDVVRGLKRGFTFFKHEKGQPFQVAPDRSNQLLVAASPCDELADTHWLRSDVDQFFMQEAVAAGVDYVDEAELSLPDFGDAQVSSPSRLGRGAEVRRGVGSVVLTGRRRGEPFRVEARFVVDATGPRGLLSKVLDIPEEPFPNYPKTHALFSHFTGVRRCDTIPDFAYAPENGAPPYPIDDAALHHVFDGGWMWVLRFGNGVTSAGIAVTEEFGVDIGLPSGGGAGGGNPQGCAAAWPRFLRRYPSIAAQFAEATPIQPFSYGSRLSYRASTMVGENWAMLPSAAAFIDPLFSTGFPLTLLGIERLGRILDEAWGTAEMPARLAEYARSCRAEGEATAALIAGAYGGFSNFPAFASLSMFYFAAASFSEMQRRVTDMKSPAAYLQSNHPRFAPSMAHFAAEVRDRARDMNDAELRVLDSAIASAVDCINVAGLCDPVKRNRYGVDLNDVVVSASKLGFTPEEMRTIIDTADWAKGCS